jgi:L-arabinose isomerase
VYSQNLSTEYLEDFSEMMGIELLVIGKDTTIRELKNEIRFNDIAYK